MNIRWTRWLLAIWFVATFGVTLMADSIHADFFGWPFEFWMGAQGSLLICVAIVWVYAWKMDQLDHQAHRQKLPQE